MLELIGTTVLTAVVAVNLNAAIAMMPMSPAQKLTTVAIAGLWIGFAIALGPSGSMRRRRHRCRWSESWWYCRW